MLKIGGLVYGSYMVWTLALPIVLLVVCSNDEIEILAPFVYIFSRGGLI